MSLEKCGRTNLPSACAWTGLLLMRVLETEWDNRFKKGQVDVKYVNGYWKIFRDLGNPNPTPFGIQQCVGPHCSNRSIGSYSRGVSLKGGPSRVLKYHCFQGSFGMPSTTLAVVWWSSTQPERTLQRTWECLCKRSSTRTRSISRLPKSRNLGQGGQMNLHSWVCPSKGNFNGKNLGAGFWDTHSSWQTIYIYTCIIMYICVGQVLFLFWLWTAGRKVWIHSRLVCWNMNPMTNTLVNVSTCRVKLNYQRLPVGCIFGMPRLTFPVLVTLLISTSVKIGFAGLLSGVPHGKENPRFVSTPHSL